MIKAIFWDFGGVITSSPFEAFNRYEQAHGLPRDFIRMLNARDPDNNAWARFERSEITLEEFDRAFAEESAGAGYAVPGHEVIRLLAGEPRPQMVAALKICGEHFINACLTNNVRVGEGPGMQPDADKAGQVADIMRFFDVVVESSSARVRKPDPAFYRLACERTGVQPTEVVYLDDLGVNLKPARAMGMTTIKVVEPGLALDELGRCTGLDFSLLQG